MPDIAFVSVITTGVVGLAAAITPAVTRYTDRRYEEKAKAQDNIYKRREQYWALRESLYLDLITVYSNGIVIFLHQEKGRDGEAPEAVEGINIRSRSIAYASDQVRALQDALMGILQVLGGIEEPGEDVLEIARITELTPDNQAAARKEWINFAVFMHNRLIDQIRGELSAGQISMQGIGEPVEHDVIKTYLAKSPIPPKSN